MWDQARVAAVPRPAPVPRTYRAEVEALEDRTLPIVGSSRALLSQALLRGFGHVRPTLLNRHGIPRILNGTTAGQVVPGLIEGVNASEFPSVGLVGERGYGAGCTGVLISPMHVLTAAHCVEETPDRAATFTINGQLYRSQRIFVHPRYHPYDIGYDSANDIAIIRLRQPVLDVQPSPINRGAPQVGDMLTLVGFGAGGSTAGHWGDFGTKRVGLTPIEVISGKLLTWYYNSDVEANTGPGDSGGPAFIQRDGVLYIAGITSGGDRDDAGWGSASYDTRVDAYASWIDRVLSGRARQRRPVFFQRRGGTPFAHAHSRDDHQPARQHTASTAFRGKSRIEGVGDSGNRAAAASALSPGAIDAFMSRTRL